jgi:hypothetical protein
MERRGYLQSENYCCYVVVDYHNVVKQYYCSTAVIILPNYCFGILFDYCTTAFVCCTVEQDYWVTSLLLYMATVIA